MEHRLVGGEEEDGLVGHARASWLDGGAVAVVVDAQVDEDEVGIDAIDKKEQALMNRFLEGVRTIEGVTVYGDFGNPRTAIVSLNIWDWDSGQVSDILSMDYDIATRPGAHCAPLMHKALGTVSQGAVRFSFSYFNTEEEIDFAVKAVRDIAEDR
jgi:selenocysteine lyase/cysteine desulfurase